jgi:hypothetical protein
VAPEPDFVLEPVAAKPFVSAPAVAPKPAEEPARREVPREYAAPKKKGLLDLLFGWLR